jgi:arginyl-tRNA synthetase
MVKKYVEKSVDAMLKEAGAERPERLQVIVERPAQTIHGEYSTNVAMQLAKTLRRAPIAIANELQSRLMRESELAGAFARMEVAPPGFLNFYVKWERWVETADQAEGSVLFEARAAAEEKVVIEHTSINPNKSAHIGHLRNSCIGDTLARLLRAAGRRVEVHNYIDDLGNQLADTVVGLLHSPAESSAERFGDYCWDTYALVNRAYKDSPALQEKRAEVLHEREEGKSNTAWLGSLVAERIVREQLEEMKQFGIGYDVLVWESSIVREGFWNAAFEQLKRTGSFGLETQGKLSGCWVLKQSGETGHSDVNDEEHQADKVLVRSNGILTYTAKDIAYHLWKFGLLQRDFTYKPFESKLWTTAAGGATKRFGRAHTVINVIDRRQEYPQAMVKEALRALGFEAEAERLLHVGYGVVSLSPATAAGLGIDTSDGKSSYAMSGRQGIGIKSAELLDRMEQTVEAKRSRKAGLSSRAIAAAAIRYYLLKYHLQTEVVFDLQQATEVSGNSGVYLLYSYTRAGSILGKAGKEPNRTPRAPVPMPQLEQAERELLRHLAYWPETLKAAAEQLAPNVICTYAFELASLFTAFYGACPILKAEGEQRELRLWLTAKFHETLGQALSVLGLPSPKRM